MKNQIAASYTKLAKSRKYTLGVIYDMLAQEFNIPRDNIKKYIREMTQPKNTVK